MSLTKKRTLSKISFVCALAVILVIVLLYLYNIIKWGNIPDYGFGYRTAAGIGIVGVVTDPGRTAGMEVGDQILLVNGKPFKNMKEFRVAQNREISGKNTYLVQRQEKQFEITMTNTPLKIKGSFMRSGLTYLMGLCYVLIGVLVFLMKPHQRISWIFFIFGVTIGLFFTFFVKLGELNPPWLGTIHILINTLVAAAFIHLALGFPEERKLIRTFPYAQFLPYLASIFLFVSIRQFARSLVDAPQALYFLLIGYIAVGILIFLTSCFQLWITSRSQIVKLRSKMILLGVAISALVPLFEISINSLFHSHIFPSFNYYLPFLIVFPSFVGYSIVKHNLFDIDAIIKRTYGYVLTTGAIAGVYALFVSLSNLAFGRLDVAKSPLFPFLFVLAVVFFFNPIRNRVQRIIDRVFYRLEYDYQETVAKVSDAMRSLLNLDQIRKKIVDLTLGTMFIDSVSVMLLNPKEEVFDCLAVSYAAPISTFKLPADNLLLQKVGENKKEVTIYDIQEDPLYEKDREVYKKTFEKFDATLFLPLIYEDRVTGLISLGKKKSGKFYRREDINLLRVLANQGAVAIENAKLFEENIQKSRMEEELKIAHDIQLSMLPDQAPIIEGLSIAAKSIPAREVGGDFYDFIEIMENGAKRLGIVVGDVSGKAVSGALVMAASRSIFRVLTETHESVEEVMNRGNVRLLRDVKKGMFVALLYAVLDSKEKTMVFSNAGQVQPILCSPEKSKAEYVDTEGDRFPLGIVTDCHYQETRVSLKQGDNLVFYTDGMVEAVNDKGELYGFERFLASIEEGRELGANELLDKLINDVMRYVGKVEQHDDLTAVVVKVG
jgi:serine phosphatase RsbU (regulator of sigma subunit)